jgi:alpha-1,3-rhamnosyltransferase
MDKVSVIIPSFNHKSFVIESINSVLAQTYKDIELIVIDDGSTDGSVELLKDLASRNNFKLILKENEGVCATLNRGLVLSSGSYITFIASDDYMPPNRIIEQLQVFELHPDADVVAGRIHVVDERSHVISTKNVRGLGFISLDQMFKKNMIFAPTAMLKKTVFEKYGFYREDYLFEDYYMWLKILSSGGKIFNSDKVWAYYRINSGNLEKRFNWYYKGYIQTLSDYLPEARAQKAIKHYRLIYCAKMTFLQGLTFFRVNYSEIAKLKFPFRVVLLFVAFLPNKMRQELLMFLLKEI